MPARPNFHNARIDGGQVRVNGESPDDTADLIDIRVTLAQGARVASASVERVATPWEAVLDVTDPEGEAPDFQTGDVVAIGIEYRAVNHTTISWAQPLSIN